MPGMSEGEPEAAAHVAEIKQAIQQIEGGDSQGAIATLNTLLKGESAEIEGAEEVPSFREDLKSKVMG